MGSRGGRPAAFLCLFASRFAASSVAGRVAAVIVCTGTIHQVVHEGNATVRYMIPASALKAKTTRHSAQVWHDSW